MKTIAILLTVFNRCEQTLRCLEAVRQLLRPEGVQIKAFLVEDGCTDGTPEAVAEQFPEVEIIHGDGSLYWNRGMYTAWAAAAKHDFDYYLWLNDDTFVLPDMLTVLLQAAAATKHKAIIVGSTTDTGRTRLTYGGFRRGRGLMQPNGMLQPIEYFNGNIVLVPRIVYQQLGNLDYTFRHSKGDFDYGHRARKTGIEMFVAPSYLGECDEHPVLDAWCNPAVPLRQRWKMLNRPNGMPPAETFYFERKHVSFFTALFHYFTVNLRCVFPKLWKIKDKR